LTRLSLALLVALAGCTVEVAHGLPETEANTILAALDQSGIPARKVRARRGGQAAYSVEVGRADAPAAWRTLRQHNLPAPRSRGLREFFGSPGLAPGRARRQALLRQALAGELARTLGSVDGVLEARVHLGMHLAPPAGSPLSSPPLPVPRASVLLQVRGRSPLTAHQVRELVAGAVSGLEQRAVSVVIKQRPDRRPAAAAPRLVALGPFSVAPDSRGPLLITLSGLLVLLAAAGAAVLLLLWRARRPPVPSPPAPAPAPDRDPQLERDTETGLTLLDQSFRDSTVDLSPPERQEE
jgi:type III secretion protein J